MNGRRLWWSAVLALAWALTCGMAHGQRIHLLMAGDTQDPDIGDSVENDLKSLVDVFFGSIPEGQFKFNILRREFTGATVKRAIGEIQPSPEDTLVFYWSGHGAMDSDGRHWFQMPDRGRLYRSEVLEELKRKKVRLVVLLSDCCSVFVPPRVRPGQPSIASPTVIVPLFDELFLRPVGVVDINACAEGEVALCDGAGGFFTLAMAHWAPPGGRPLAGEGAAHATGLFWARQQDPLDWPGAVRAIQEGVDRIFRQAHPEGFRTSGGDVQGRQTLKVWELPKAGPPRPPARRRLGITGQPVGGTGVRVTAVEPGSIAEGLSLETVTRVRQLEAGDVLVSVNGRAVPNTQTYWAAVKESPQEMQFSFRDVRTGQRFRGTAVLNPPGSPSRLGVEAVPSGDGGMRITRVWPGYPGTRVFVHFPGNRRRVALGAGDVVLSADGQAVSDPAELAERVRRSKGRLSLSFRRGDEGDVYHVIAPFPN